ncbi:MAG: BON domain-containing protein [Alphaproteobacteria bacterium]|nr:BON domain-containing protein [Alphaproteobacteria bacterium]
MLFRLKQILTFKNKFQNFNYLVILLLLSTFLTGCTSLAILGIGTGAGVLTGGYIMGRDKTVAQSTDDTIISTQIKHKLFKQYPNVFTDITVATDNGCVLLAGNVQDDRYIREAEKIAWTIDGVKKVNNNLTCNKITSNTQALQDSYVTSACRTKLIATKNIKSRNIKINTNEGIVYLSGIAHSEDELEDIISVVKSIKGVKKVFSYIIIKETIIKRTN